MLIRVIDFETTGLPPDARICEYGFCDVNVYPGPAGTSIGRTRSFLVDPGMPMPIEAQAVHHIGDSDLFGAPSADCVPAALMAGEPHIFVAHNAKFEQAFFNPEGSKWICTYKVALRLWPDAPVHSNQGLRYFLGLGLDPARCEPIHRAGPDAYVTANILVDMMARAGVEQMLEWTSQPAVLPICRFGKHRGKKWEDIPTDYLDWLTRQQDMDEDVRHTASLHIERRRDTPD